MALNRRRIVVVGLGSIGRRHARLLAARPDMAVEYCDASTPALAQARAEAGDHKTHPSFEAAVESRPEMMVIATPHQLHAAQTIAALRAGIDVLCEKPMSDSLPDARRMAAAAVASGRVLTFGFHMHFHPGIMRMRQLIQQGELGKLVVLRCHIGAYIALVNSASRYQASLEGALLLDYAHQPDLLFLLLGRRPAGVYMAGGRGGDLEHQSNPNFLTLICDYDGGMQADIHLNYIQTPFREAYELVGDRAWVGLDAPAGRLTISRRADASVVHESAVTERDPLHEAVHQAFFDAVDGKRLAESPPESAIVAMEVAEAAMRSWKAGRRIELNEL